jgi:hypothetical protein
MMEQTRTTISLIIPSPIHMSYAPKKLGFLTVGDGIADMRQLPSGNST